MKRIGAIILTLMLLIPLASCSRMQTQERTSITMYLWDKSMSRQLTPWLEQQFPEVDFTFIVGYNSIDFYSNLLSHGEFPDIITCRRFSLNDASKISGQLLDLSRTELAGMFYSAYIENNRESDGAIKWLPMCAEIDGLIANMDVFRACGVELPTCYREFAEACSVFEQHGIRCFENDYSEDYSCLEAIQGCAIPELMSLRGINWRLKYENEGDGAQVGLDEQLWGAVLKKFEQFLKDTCARAEDTETSFSQMKDDFLSGRCAMMRGTGNDCAVFRAEAGIDCVMLPYFGETDDENWLLTYPIYQVAVNKDLSRDPEKQAIVMKVLREMFSAEGQSRAAAGTAVITYSETVSLEALDGLEPVWNCVKKNHMFQRLASTEFFTISRNVAFRMIRGEIDADEACEDFNAQLLASGEAAQGETVASLQTGYPYGPVENPAASALVNTLRRETGADLMIGYSSLVTSSVYEGDYTAQQLRWWVCNRAGLQAAKLTGGQVYEVMEWLVNVKENGANPVRHRNLLPVVGGMEYAVRAGDQGSYALLDVTICGEPLDREAVYDVLLMGDDGLIEGEVYCGCPMPEEIRERLQATDGSALEYLIDALSEGGQLEEPTDYLEIH